MQRENTKTRQQFDSENLSEDKGQITKKHHQSPESSSSRQQEPKKQKEHIKEIIKEKSVAKELKILKGRVQRRIMKDNREDVKALMMMRLKAIRDNNNKAAALNSGKTTMEVANSGKTTMEVANDESVEVRVALENLNKQWRKDSTKANNLDAVFADNEGFSEKSLKREFSLELRTTFSSLQNEVFAMENNKVDVSHFPGLQEALEKTTWGKIPDYLEPIAIRIEKARGKATELSHRNIQVLVCAAIQEMEDLPLEKLNRNTFKKWGATLNMAKQQCFQVEFAETLLRKNLFAYFAYSVDVE